MLKHGLETVCFRFLAANLGLILFSHLFTEEANAGQKEFWDAEALVANFECHLGICVQKQTNAAVEWLFRTPDSKFLQFRLLSSFLYQRTIQ